MGLAGWLEEEFYHRRYPARKTDGPKARHHTTDLADKGHVLSFTREGIIGVFLRCGRGGKRESEVLGFMVL